MRIIFVILSIALIFVGIAAVLYVDARSQEEKSKKEVMTETSSPYRPSTTDNFAPKPSMREIDSITSAYNYHFTVDNAVPARIDSSKKPVTAKKM